MHVARELHMDGGTFDIALIARDHYACVYRFCARRVGLEAASDCAQETFLTAQRSIGRFAGRSDIKTWLLGIAHNECRRMVRSRRLEPAPLELWDAPDGESAEQTLIDRHALQQALAKLSPEHREVVYLKEMEGITYEEAGEILGVPAGTVKSRLYHALQHLRRLLGELS